MVKTVFDLDVFKRVYRVSLELHKASLELIAKEQWLEWQKEYKDIAMMLNGFTKTR